MEPIHLRNSDLSGHRLIDVDFNGADLRNTNFSRANMSRSNLKGTDLRYAKLYSVNLSYANIRNADLRLADLRCADLIDADLRGANLIDTDLRGAWLYRVKGIYPLNMNDPRGYVPYAQIDSEGTLMIGSGCRYFNLNDALKHWGSEYRGWKEIGDRYLDCLKRLDVEALHKKLI